MCGIAGFWVPAGLDDSAVEILGRMTSAIGHRGPDDAGCWCDSRLGVALGHRRLSVIDLSPEGHQPMASPDGRFSIVYNGEVYNFLELKAALQRHGATFRSHSDTEVMLAAFERHGVVSATQRFAGMFAFALVDRVQNQLHLVRDRLGEKPLYYGWAGDVLLFGSELKALRQHPAWRADIDRGSLALFLRHGFIPAPSSIYQGIRKVVPGTILTFDLSGHRTEPRETVYWSAREAAEFGTADAWSGSDTELLNELDRLLRQTVRREMVADVPLGAFLSGGIDSSLVVALMQAESERPVRTFTIGFDEPEYNEANHAKRVARHLGTDHTELYVRPAEALAIVPMLPTLYDEPFADSSQIPTFLVSQLARRHVTVSLSGDGGDELFGGYDRYSLARRTWGLLRHIPRVGRHVLAGGLRSVTPGGWDRVLGATGINRWLRPSRHITGDRVHKVARILSLDSQEMMYLDLMSHWKDPRDLLAGVVEPPTALTDRGRWAKVDGALERMMYLDLVMYLPDDILVKVDRASMGVSLESRAPFLDHRVVEFAWRIPSRLRLRDSRGKWPVRQLLGRYVPGHLTARPKMGFGVPIEHWLRGPLKEWATALLDPHRLTREGFLNPEPIARKWSEHQDGRRNWHYLLWDVLMFQSWLNAQ